MPTYAGEQPIDLRTGLEVPHYTPRRNDEVEGAAEVELADTVRADGHPAWWQLGVARLLPAEGEHRLGPIDALDEAAALRELD